MYFIALQSVSQSIDQSIKSKSKWKCSTLISRDLVRVKKNPASVLFNQTASFALLWLSVVWHCACLSLCLCYADYARHLYWGSCQSWLYILTLKNPLQLKLVHDTKMFVSHWFYVVYSFSTFSRLRTLEWCWFLHAHFNIQLVMLKRSSIAALTLCITDLEMPGLSVSAYSCWNVYVFQLFFTQLRYFIWINLHWPLLTMLLTELFSVFSDAIWQRILNI